MQTIPTGSTAVRSKKLITLMTNFQNFKNFEFKLSPLKGFQLESFEQLSDPVLPNLLWQLGNFGTEIRKFLILEVLNESNPLINGS